MKGRSELTLIGILALAVVLGLGLLSDRTPAGDPFEHGPYTANGLAWNN